MSDFLHVPDLTIDSIALGILLNMVESSADCTLDVVCGDLNPDVQMRNRNTTGGSRFVADQLCIDDPINHS
jgi:hypothetical protein